MNRFDKPYRIAPSFDTRKNIEMFDLASKLDTHELLQHSLINKIPFDVSDEEANTLIHIVINVDSRKASQHAKLGVIKFLVNNGANPDKPNKYNQTPLHLACHYQYDLIVEYLLSIDVNPNFQDNMGLTPFHYLLTGDIKSIENTGEIMNFIPPAKKQDVEKNEKLLDIKKQIYNILVTRLIKDEFPIFKTFSNTITNILESDSEFISQRVELEQKIVKLAQDTSLPNYLGEIKNTVNVALKSISKKIERLFNGFPEQSDLQIHSTDKLSWSHPTNTQPLSLIKNGDIKKSIKNEIARAGEDIINLSSDFKPISINFSSYETDGLNEMMEIYLGKFNKAQFTKIPGSNEYYYSSTMSIPERKLFLDVNNMLKHPNAFDNASSIIDFKNLKYTGGPRNVPVRFINTQLTNLNPVIPIVVPTVLEEVKRISVQLNSNEKILYMLDPPISLISLKAIANDIQNGTLDIINITGANYTRYFQPDLDANMPPDPFYKQAMFCYVVFAFVGISNPDKFKELGDNPYIKNIIDTNSFAAKWFRSYLDGCNAGSFVYGMYLDMVCYLSSSNLDSITQTNLRVLMLVAGLANETISLDQSICNAYKPQVIADLCNSTSLTSEQEKITAITMMILNENCTGIYWTNIEQNYSTLASIPTTGIDTKVLTIGALVLKYFTNPTGFSANTTSPEDKLFRAYAKSGKKPIWVLSNIIIDFVENMANKPLKQTMLDFIYLLNSYDQAQIKNINIFKQMTTREILLRPLDLSKNIQPSHYGLENVQIDSSKFSHLGNIVQNHWHVAHTLGLYFEGMCNPHEDYDTSKTFSVMEKGKSNKVDYKDIYIIRQPAIVHTFSPTNDLIANQLPLPFNNVVLAGGTALPPIRRATYYNIDNRPILNPSVYSYFVMLVTRIKYYQDKIKVLLKFVETYTEEIKKGKTTNMGSLITTIYPKLVTLCKITNSYVESVEKINKNYENKDFWKHSELKSTISKITTYDYVELAKSINTINASFYLYYYIFSPNKLFKLNKFNYYQIPINSPGKYWVFNDPMPVANVYDPVTMGQPVAPAGPAGPTDLTTIQPSTGLVGQFSIGNYNSFYDEYKLNNFNTTITDNSASFNVDKTNKLPPSLSANLEIFYKYCLIELVIKTISEIDTNKSPGSSTNGLYTSLISLVKSSGIEVNDLEISAYHLVSKIVQEIVREQFAIYVNNEVNDVFRKAITNLPSLSGLPVTDIFTQKEMSVSIDKTDIEFSKITKSKQVKNLYNILIQPTKSDVFILYPNDLTNISKLKMKTGITVNTKIIELLLEKRGSPYNVNFDGQSPIYNLIKNFNYGPVKALKNLGVDFRDFEGELPMEFLLKEFSNSIDKAIGSNLKLLSNKDLLSNWDNYLFNDVKTLITSNEVYGNNVLGYLPLSFNICTYIVLQYLLENLINTDDIYTLDDLSEFLNFIEVDINDINKNYLGEIIGKFKIPVDLGKYIAKEFLIEKVNQLKNIKKEKQVMDDNIAKLTVSNPSLATKLNSSSKYSKITNDMVKLSSDIANLSATIRTITGNIKNKRINEYKIIKRYRALSGSSVHNALIMVGWEKMLELPYDKSNYNLGLIQLLIKQKALCSKLNLANMETLRKISKPLSKLAEIGQEYFSGPKFTETNKTAHFVRDMIEYLTEISICTGLELVIRRILYTYFSNASPDDSQDDISDRIDFILEADTYGTGKSLLTILKTQIAPELAKNSSEIFANRSEEQGYLVRPPRDILIGFFQLLENSPIKLPNEIMAIFIKDVVSYFDTFTSRTIGLWQVNAENIFKYFINNYRCVETILSL